MTQIAFLGLGAMGSRMAANLIDAGFAVTVWNRDASKAEPLAAKGARIAGAPRAAAIGADIVFAMVRDDDASARVWLDPETGALTAMRAGAIAVESSTLTLAHTQRLAQAAAQFGVSFLDAPVAGSRPQAEARQLIHLVGGAAEALAQVEPALTAIGGAIHHVGPNGAGMAMKLAINTLFGVQVAALAEIFGVLAKLGIDGARAADIIGATPTASPAAKGAMASMATGHYAPLFPVDLAAKDFAYMLASARTAHAAMPISDIVASVYEAAKAHGFGKEQLTAIRKLY
jgi:3-hydroxyisobutyrate dehydrogenase-like beta-hydroxyacid dehydrogenase